MVEEIAAVSKISADHSPEDSARLPPSKRLQRTARRVEILGIVVLRKVVGAVVIKAAGEVVFIAVLPHLAAVDRVSAVEIAVVSDRAGGVVATAVAADPAGAVVVTTVVADPAGAAAATAVVAGPAGAAVATAVVADPTA